jgi:hypothetical protein
VFHNRHLKRCQITLNPFNDDCYKVHISGIEMRLLVAVPYGFLRNPLFDSLSGALKDYYQTSREDITWQRQSPRVAGSITEQCTPGVWQQAQYYFARPSTVFDPDAASKWVPRLPPSFEEPPKHFIGDGPAFLGAFFKGFRFIAAYGGKDCCSALFYWHGMLFFCDAAVRRVMPLGKNLKSCIQKLWQLDYRTLEDKAAGWVSWAALEKYGASHFFDKDRPIFTADRRFQAAIDADAAAEWRPHLPESFHIPPPDFHGDTPGLVELFFKGYKVIAARGPGKCIGALFQWRGVFFYWDSTKNRALPLGAEPRPARQLLWLLEEDRPLPKEIYWLSWADLDYNAATKMFRKTTDGYYLKWPMNKDMA